MKSASRPKKRLLTIDIGNTSASLALYSPVLKKRPRPLKFWRIETSLFSSSSARRLRKILVAKIGKRGAGDVMVSSVVPKANAPLKKALRGLSEGSPVFISARTPSRVKVRYQKPEEVGSDRLVNARGALALSRGPLIVIDFGTATTFDCVTRRDEYLGGVITPGPAISAQALYVKTAKLPHVYLTRPAEILGRNTQESIQSGLYHGVRGMANEIIARLKKKLGSSTQVFATGGQADWLVKGLPSRPRPVWDLTHLGLYWMWRDSQNLSKKKF